MRKGFDGLAVLVQQVLEKSPHSGALFAFRGNRGDLVKLLWYDGQGLCLFSKRMDRGRFVWPITKAGNTYLRSLLVNGAHYILGPFGPACNLRRHGEALMKRGGKNAKKRAVVAVARKLAVLLHALWKSGAMYEPDRGWSAAA